ncbi:MAG: hypothetical protein L0229_28885 [Blastocatellia bacterium]|nr:hypothetical protein [Blastocatellia bacterium]
MEKGENRPAHEKRHLEVYVDDEDVLAEVLDVTEGDYQCVTINHSWPEKGLLEGDVILFDRGTYADTGDIVLIEERGQRRAGLVFEPGFLETPLGSRPLEAQEQIIGIAVALARRLRKD